MRIDWEALGKRASPTRLGPCLLCSILISLLFQPCYSMKLDPERIAARLRIDEKWDELEAFGAVKSRRGRQIQPKEISIQVTAPLFSSRLFDYGTQAGDQEMPQALDVGKKVELSNPISFYGSEYKTAYILSNGAIGFDANSRSYKAGVLPGPSRLIAPFWNRNDLRNGGKVYYREITKGRVLERGQSEIRYQYDKNVKVKSALIVTWDKMQPLNTAALPDENTNTFQAAIFITENGTFANFIYSNIGWTQGAESGFNAGDATNHFKLPTSGTPNIMYLEEYGNTGIPGEWMFELTDLRVISCKSGIKGDTCDQECSSGEWGPDCAYCCHCADGTCHPVTGDCSKGCGTCWGGVACQTRQDKCATRQQCAPNALSFNDYDRCGEPIQRCQCLNGFSGDGYNRCDDIDECAKNATICHENAICTNTPGRFFCQCREGFSGDGQSECSQSFLFQYDAAKQLPRKKNSKLEWTLRRPMTVFGQTLDKLTITSSGLISIEDVNKEGTSTRLEDMRVVGVAPFFAPIDISRAGAITVQEVDDEELLRRVTRTIAENYNDASYEAKNALVVTFSNVTDGKQQKGNTFQTILIDGVGAKGEKMTFVEIMYRDMPWSGVAEAGILSRDSSSSILLPASGTEAISQLAKLSNIKQPGSWLFRIDRPQVMPCAQSIQVPPYCDRLQGDRSSNLNVHAESRPKPSSRLLEEKKEDLTLPEPGVFEIEQPTETIKPTLSKGKTPMTISVSSRPIEASPPPKTTVRTTPRPRPNFSSTPHRPLVSLSDEDFELGPDAFEVTFPPFVTVVPELFQPNRQKNKATTQPSRPTSKQMPDFSIRTPLKEDPEAENGPTTPSTTKISLKTTLPGKSTRPRDEEMTEEHESPFEEIAFNGDSQIFTDTETTTMKSETTPSKSQKTSTMTTESQEAKEEEDSKNDKAADDTESHDEKVPELKKVELVKSERRPEEEEEDEMEETMSAGTMKTMMVSSTTEMTTTTEEMKTTTDTPPTIFVFTTTPRSTPTTRSRLSPISVPRKPQTPPNIVTAATRPPPNAGQAEEQGDRKLAIILPVSIILAWMLILLCIAGFVCCKKRNSRETSQLRSMYGATYGVRPTSYESKRKESTYEDHLERAARLGGNPQLAAQQAGKISLYGSYWNLHHSPGRLSTQEQRQSPPGFINNGYSNPTRYTYAGHY